MQLLDRFTRLDYDSLEDFLANYDYTVPENFNFAYDVMDEYARLAPGQRAMIPTGLAIELPDASCVALVYARSGLAIKHGLTLSNSVGVIDSDYRGEIRVGLVNLGGEAYTIAPGERVAQLCIAPVWQAAFVQADALNDTARGAGGFGSTGKL